MSLRGTKQTIQSVILSIAKNLIADRSFVPQDDKEK
jgi:hypothetical protein